MNKIKVLFIAAELTPLAKVGGLADVVGALPKELSKLGLDVRIVIPKYGSIDTQKYQLKKIAHDLTVPFNNAQEKIAIYETPLPGSTVPVYLIENSKYLGQNGIYFEKDAAASGSNREAERFTFLARSCFEIFKPIGWYPDVLHCHDWHVGLVPMLAEILGEKDATLAKIKTLLTIHNLEYQGWYKRDLILSLLGISTSSYPTLSEVRDNCISSLQQAILTSDFINTVSPNYAKEILTPEFGAGLEPLLVKRKGEMVGILNGIDVERFNPATDPDIAANYSSADLTGKNACKAELQKLCNFETNPRTPLLSVVSRLADQKGINLVADVLEDLQKLEMQFVLLGTGNPKIEKTMMKLSEKYPKKIYVQLKFDAVLAQKIYAGSDIFLMPSRFEPCGLGQMIAMRYGTVPVVRTTGGLKDTVMDYDQSKGEGDGFTFQNLKAEALFAAINRALSLYEKKEKWYTIIKGVMQKDFSWTHSAKEYLKLYEKITS